MRVPVSIKAFAVFSALAATTAALGVAAYLGLADLRRASRRIDTVHRFQLQVGVLGLYNRARTLRQGGVVRESFAETYGNAEALAREVGGMAPLLPAPLAPRVASLHEHLGYVRLAFDELFDDYRKEQDLTAAADAAHEELFRLGADGQGGGDLRLLPVVHRMVTFHRRMVEDLDPAGAKEMKALSASLRRPGAPPRAALLAERFTLLTEQAYLVRLAVRDRERFLEDTGQRFSAVASETVDAISRASLSRQRQVTATLAGTVAFAGLLTVVLWGGSLRYIRSFLRHFRDAVAAIRGGRYDYPAPEVPRDEIGDALLFLRDLAHSLGESLDRLRESEERFRSLVEDISDWVWETGADGRFVYSSPVVQRLLSVSASDLVGRRPEELMPRAEAARFGSVLRRSLAGGGSARAVEAVFAGPGDDAVVLEASWQPVLAPDGAVLGLRGISRDITERRRAEEEQARLRAQLLQAQKLEAIGTLTGGIAHDFNNLLQSMTGYTEMLLRQKAETDPDVPKLRTIERAAQRAAELTRQLLVFGRQIESRVALVDLNREVGQACDLLARTIPKMISLQTRLARDLWPVVADATQLEQVLVNLAVNAKDAMPEGGVLEFATENAEAAPDGDLPEGRWVRLTVRDSGQGMTDAVRQRIFEPFFTTKEVGKGTGLGLAIVYGIVQGHGGHVRCESAPGQGTSFHIYLPAGEAGAVAAGPAAIEPEAPGGSETLLLVDDEDVLLELGTEILSAGGYRVVTASSGEEALGVLGSGQAVDLVLLDLNMPGMGGMECLRQARRAGAAVPFAVASGYPPAELRSELGELGVSITLRKPFRAAELLGAVRRALDGRGTPSR